MRNLRLVVLACTLAAAAPAFGSDLATCTISPERQAELGCLCAVPISEPVALLDQVAGKVVRSDAAAYSQVEEKTWLSIGDKVLFGDDGHGVVSAQNCHAAAGPSASLIVQPVEGGCACVALLEDPKAAVPANHGGLLLGGAAQLGAALVIHSISP
jgi:hypothetical protein